MVRSVQLLHRRRRPRATFVSTYYTHMCAHLWALRRTFSFVEGGVLVPKDFLGVFADLARHEVVHRGFFSTGRIFARYGFVFIK